MFGATTFKAGEDRMRSTNFVAIIDVPEPVSSTTPLPTLVKKNR